jgi:hypothetical protein
MADASFKPCLFFRVIGVRQALFQIAQATGF